LVVSIAVRSRGVPENYQPEGTSPGDRLPLALVRTGDKTKFLRIKGGAFTMGNDFDKSGSQADEDQPAHEVTLSDFYLQETEVTNREMDAYFLAKKVARAARPPRYQEAWDQIEKAGVDPLNFPAVGVSHALAEEYARSVGGRLPTEAQWEYAARSLGKKRRFIWEGDDPPSHRNVNIDSRGDFGDLLTTQEVRRFKLDRTEQGIFDMTGNVREWCRDHWQRYAASQEPRLDPEGPAGGGAMSNVFVIRGGSFDSIASEFRTTRPRRADPDERTGQQLTEDGTAEDVGFRVVIEWPRKH